MLPSQNDHCSNPNNNGISSPLLLPNHSEALESPQTLPAIASCSHSNAFNTLRWDKLLTMIREQYSTSLQVHLASSQCTIYTVLWLLHSRLSHWSATRGPFRSCLVQFSHPVTSNNPFSISGSGRWHNQRRNKPNTLRPVICETHVLRSGLAVE